MLRHVGFQMVSDVSETLRPSKTKVVTTRHDVPFHKTCIFISTAVRASNLHNKLCYINEIFGVFVCWRGLLCRVGL